MCPLRVLKVPSVEAPKEDDPQLELTRKIGLAYSPNEIVSKPYYPDNEMALPSRLKAKTSQLKVIYLNDEDA